MSTSWPRPSATTSPANDTGAHNDDGYLDVHNDHDHGNDDGIHHDGVEADHHNNDTGAHNDDGYLDDNGNMHYDITSETSYITITSTNINHHIHDINTGHHYRLHLHNNDDAVTSNINGDDNFNHDIHINHNHDDHTIVHNHDDGTTTTIDVTLATGPDEDFHGHETTDDDDDSGAHSDSDDDGPHYFMTAASDVYFLHVPTTTDTTTTTYTISHANNQSTYNVVAHNNGYDVPQTMFGVNDNTHDFHFNSTTAGTHFIDFINFTVCLAVHDNNDNNYFNEHTFYASQDEDGHHFITSTLGPTTTTFNVSHDDLGDDNWIVRHVHFSDGSHYLAHVHNNVDNAEHHTDATHYYNITPTDTTINTFNGHVIHFHFDGDVDDEPTATHHVNLTDATMTTTTTYHNGGASGNNARSLPVAENSDKEEEDDDDIHNPDDIHHYDSDSDDNDDDLFDSTINTMTVNVNYDSHHPTTIHDELEHGLAPLGFGFPSPRLPPQFGSLR
jgi:hypothetical protein